MGWRSGRNGVGLSLDDRSRGVEMVKLDVNGKVLT